MPKRRLLNLTKPGPKPQVNTIWESNLGANYDEEQVQFLKAMDKLCRDLETRHPHPLDVLDAALDMGYRKVIT